MLLLDYRLPRTSYYILFLDAPFRYSWRHLIQYFNARIIRKQTGVESLTKKERAIHFWLAFLEMVPFLGMAVAIIDRQLFYRNLKPLTTYSEVEKSIASYMLATYVPLYCKIFGNDAQKQTSKQERYILPRYLAEMKQVAHDTDTPFSQVLLANTILDRLTLFGGSIKATHGEATKVATSYFHSHGRGDDVFNPDKSFWRFDELQKSSHPPKKALSRVNMPHTIASCIYDGKNQCLYYSFGSDHAANRLYKRYNLKPLLKTPHDITLAHNIDFPMGLFAPFTRVFIHEKTAATNSFVSVGWLAILGTYFGINEHGLCLAACSVPGQTQVGTPNHLLFRQILEEAASADEAQKIAKKANSASSMNLIIAAKDGLARVELGRKNTKR